MNDKAHGFEHTIQQFERDFVSGNSPAIEEYVSSAGDQELLPELVHTELELRLTAGERARVENYTNRFPTLAANEEMVSDLVMTEYNVRRNFDPGCRLEEYLLRFPNLKQMLVENFLGSSTGSDSTAEPGAEGVAAVRQNSHSDMVARFRKKHLHEQGGLGNVWLARDMELDRDVAVKEIKSKFAHSPAHRFRFDRETQITGRLEHPGIVPVYGQGHTGNGAPFFAMQFVQGENLKSCIANYHNAKSGADDNSVAFNRLIQHFIDVCHTLEFAHSQNVIHRDIKPENIMIGRYGETFLIDWGLASIPDCADPEVDSLHYQANENQSASRDGQTIGSPGFMSPEQTRGDKAELSSKSDIYSLGATLFSLVTNTANPNQNLSNSGENRMDTERRQIPRELWPLLSICDRAMAHSPRQRYPSVQQLREDVESFLLDKPVLAHNDSIFERCSRFLRLNRRVLNTALISLLLLSLVSGLSAFWINSERNQAIAARRSETELRQNAELAQRQEEDARNRAEQRTRQLTRVISIVANALTGSDDAGLNLDLSKRSADQIVEQLRDQINENEDPITQAMLQTVVARGVKVTGDYSGAVGYYEAAVDLLEQDMILENDPLYVEQLVGLCSAKLGLNELDEVQALSERVKKICENEPEELIRSHFRILLLESEMALRRNEMERGLNLAEQAKEICRRLHQDDLSHSNVIWSEYVVARANRLLGKLDIALQQFDRILKDDEFGEQVHPLGIAAAVQFSELKRAEDPNLAIEVVEKALSDAGLIYSDDHPDLMRVKSRMGRLLSRHPDLEQQERGIEILTDCLEKQSESNDLENDAIMQTSLLLARALVGTKEKTKLQRAVQLLQDTIEVSRKKTESVDRAGAFIAAFYDLQSAAYQSLENLAEAKKASDKAVEWSTRAYGESFSVTKKLIEKRAKLDAE